MPQYPFVSLRRNLFVVALISAFALLAFNTALAEDRGSRVVGGYFEEWSIYSANFNIANLQSNGVADRLTHLTYAFGGVSRTGCFIADSWADYQSPYLPTITGPYTGPLYGNFAALQQLKQLHPNLKALISLNGAANFSMAANTEAGRKAFVASCIDLFINGNVATGVSAAGVFDGIDIDWEFPTAADKQNFTALLAEFRQQLNTLGNHNKKHYLLSIAAPAGSQNYSNMQLAAVARQLDFLNLETYDYHGTWETTTNHAAPLLDSPGDPAVGQGLDVSDTVTAYLNAGVPAFKILLGIPFYGRGWTGVPRANDGLYQSSTGPAPSPAGDTLATDGVATFRTLEQLAGTDGFALHRDYLSLADWLYSPTATIFWTYDDPATVTYKVVFAKLRAGGLGGAFGWALKDDDANATLVKTMAKGLNIQSH